MEYFNLNAFILGALLFACLFLSNAIYSLLCILYNIRIVEFSLFYNPWFSLHKETIMGTRFTLGWLPLAAFVKPLGMSADDNEKNKFSTDELPFAFFTKPKYLITLFNIVPWLIYIIPFFVSLILFADFTNIVSELRNILEYVLRAFETMFGNKIMREDFISSTKEIIADKNIVLFAFILLTFTMLLFTPITPIISWFSNDEKSKSKILKTIGYILTIGIFWLMLWKIPKFVFSFFTFSQSAVYITSFLIGLFSIGLVCFYSTLFVVKNIAQKLNDSKSE
jgi:hypothetical protein